MLRGRCSVVGFSTRTMSSDNTSTIADEADDDAAKFKAELERLFQLNADTETSKYAVGPDTKTVVKGDKIKVVTPKFTLSVQDEIRARHLAGLDNRYHALNRAFEALRVARGGEVDEQTQKDLEVIRDVTSLKTASAPQIRKAKTRALIEHYQRYPGDTGSMEVMLVLLTERINNMEFHMAKHTGDKKLRLVYNQLIVRRRKFLRYMKDHRFRTYQILVRDLNIDEIPYRYHGRTPNMTPYIREPKGKNLKKIRRERENAAEAAATVATPAVTQK